MGKEHQQQLKAASKKRAKIYKQHKDGVKNIELSRIYDLTPQRISQIILTERERENRK